MNTRLLLPEEYDRLKGLAFHDDWIPDPSDSKVLVAEKNGEIIAFWCLKAEIHIEPMWIKPEERRGIIGRAIVDGMRKVIHSKCYAFTESDVVAGYLERLGMREIKRRIFIGG
jgi:hypothetical protein